MPDHPDTQTEINKVLRELHSILRDQTAALKNISRPFVAIDLIPRHFVNALYLRVRNVGHTPAYEVRLSVSPPVTIREKLLNDLPLFQRPIAVLGPQDDITFFLDTAVSLYNNPEAILKFAIQADYKDSTDTKYSEEFIIDTELMRGLAVELPSPDKIAELLDDIKDEIEDIARYASELRSRDFMQRYRESQASHDPEGASSSDTQ